MSDLNIKAHAVLLISYDPETAKPIDVSEIMAKHDLQHCVCVELDLKGDGNGGYVVDKLPNGYSRAVIHGAGKNISTAITDWFHNLCSSIFYQPRYFRQRPKP